MPCATMKGALAYYGRCENDFQIDIATAEGRAEYKRIIDRAAELGLKQVSGCSAPRGVAR